MVRARRNGLRLLLQGSRGSCGIIAGCDEETIREARRVRKAFGGGMRQAGMIAAASLYAFEHHVERLAEDHERAKRLAAGLDAAGYLVEAPETNIVLVHVEDAGQFLRALASEGVLVTPRSKGAVRLCTHLTSATRR
jgi:threonine aldolase